MSSSPRGGRAGAESILRGHDDCRQVASTPYARSRCSNNLNQDLEYPSPWFVERVPESRRMRPTSLIRSVPGARARRLRRDFDTFWKNKRWITATDAARPRTIARSSLSVRPARQGSAVFAPCGRLPWRRGAASHAALVLDPHLCLLLWASSDRGLATALGKRAACRIFCPPPWYH